MPEISLTCVVCGNAIDWGFCPCCAIILSRARMKADLDNRKPKSRLERLLDEDLIQ